MRRIVLLISALFITILLVGCVSIPFGDNTLEISLEGIDIVEGDQEADEELEVTNEVTEEEEGVDDEVDEANPTKKTSSGNCEENDHSSVTDELTDDFYIPDCAELTSASITDRYVEAYFKVDGDWKEIFDEYEALFTDRIEGKELDPINEKGSLRWDVTNSDSRVTVETKDEYVSLYILQYYPE